MWFGKNIMTKLGLVLAMAVPALAADVAPLEFEGATASDYQAYWDKLMSFKMWGTDSIYLGRAQMPSLSGAIGTANNFTLKDDRHFLGGPIYVGKNFTGGNGTDTIVSGPVRVNGSFNVGVNDNVLHGTYCVGSANDDAKLDIKATPERHYGESHEAYFGKKGYDAPKGTLNEGCSAVPEVPTYLTIPDVKDVPSDAAVIPVNSGSDVFINDTYVIDVPPIEGDKKMYDYYINGSINIGSSGKLIIRMQSSKSLARFFLSGSFKLASSSIVQVVYVDKDAEYEYAATSHKAVNGSYGNWTKVSKEEPVDNKDYAGNLLFHCKDRIVWPSMNGGAYVQGSFLSRDTINLGSNLVLAGQLLATYIIVQNEFDGKSFRYVPFDPPVLEPTAGGGNILYEGHTSDNVKIELDKDHENNITFDYCFQFEGTVAVGSDYAMKADIADNLPIYDPATKTCSSTPLSSGFKAGELTLEKPIVLHVEDDDDLEHEFEEFKIWILNLDGAVLANGEHDGYITLKIKDNDTKPFGADYEVVGTEDVPYYFDAFTVTNAKGNPVADYSVKIESLPSAGSLVLVNAAGKDSVVVKVGEVIPASAINKDPDVGKLVLRFDADDYLPKKTDDADALKRYNFDFWVVDKGNASEDSYSALVTVAPVNDKPKAESAEFTIPENSETTTAVTAYAEGDVKASDVDGDELTFSFDLTADTRTAAYYKHVAELYDIDPTTGKIFVKEGAKLDYESTDSLLYVKVKVADNGQTTADLDDAMDTTVVVTIRMIDVNEAPSVSEVENLNKDYKETPEKFTLYPKENLEEGDSVGVVKADDPDVAHPDMYGHMEYSIVDPNDEIPFVMSNDTIRVKDPEKLNFEADEEVKFVFDVKVTNCELDPVNNVYYSIKTNPEKCLETTQPVTVVLQNVPEDPILKCKDETDPKCKGPYDVIEHSKKDSVIYEFVVSDPDKDQVSTLTPSISYNETPSDNSKNLFAVKVVQNPTDENEWLLQVLVAADIDYESNDLTYNVKLTVTDDDGLSASIDRIINIVDVNEKSIIEKVKDLNEDYEGASDDFVLHPKEMLEKGDSIGVVVAYDPDKLHLDWFGHMEYSIDDPNDEIPFVMSNDTIRVKDPEKLNFEAGEEVKFEFNVKVTNCELDTVNKVYYSFETNPEKCLVTTAPVTVILQDVPEGPIIKCKDNSDPKCKGPYYAIEHSKKDSVIYEFVVSDPDKDQVSTLSPSISYNVTPSDNSKNLFDVKVVQNPTDENEWLLQILVAGNIDYESNDLTYNVKLTVTDDDGLSASIDRIINIVDVNEKPTLAGKDTTIVIKENLENGKTAGEIPATDPDFLNPDAFAHLEYEIVKIEGEKVPPFKMESNKIVVKDESVLDYEVLKPDTTFTFYVKVINCPIDTATQTYPRTDKCLADSSKVTIAVTDDDEGTKIIPDCDGPDCKDICVGPSCKDEMDSICVENCDSPRDPVKVLTVAVNENSPSGYKVLNYVVVDQDVGTGHKKLEASFVNTNNSGAKNLFDIGIVEDNGQWRVVLSVIDGSKLDYETIKLSHAVTIYVKDPEDPDGMGDSLRRIINIVDVNEKPTLAGKDTTIVIKENLANGETAGIIPATDPDFLNPVAFAHLEYEIKPITGEKVPPFKMVSDNIVVTDESVLDYEVLKPDTTFTFYVKVINCPIDTLTQTYPRTDKCLADSSKVTIAVTDDDEGTKIIPDCDGPECKDVCVGPNCKDEMDSICVENCDSPRDPAKVLTVEINEHSPSGYKVLNYVAVDQDVGTGHKKLEASFVNTNNSDAKKLFNIEMVEDNGQWRVVLSVIDGLKLDYETIKLSHAVTIYVVDPEDPEGMGDSLRRVINIRDINEAPVIADVKNLNDEYKGTVEKFTMYPKENLGENAPVGLVVANDPDVKHIPEFGVKEYSIVEDPSNPVPFAMKDSLIVVKDPSKMNYESGKTVYTFKVMVENCEWVNKNGTYVKTDKCVEPVLQEVTVKIQNVNEKPEIVIDDPKDPDGKDDSDPFCVENCTTEDRGNKDGKILTVGIEEKVPKGTTVFEYYVEDVDAGDLDGLTVSWKDVASSIPSVNKKGSDLFEISYDKTTHKITVKTKAELDYETLRNATSKNDPDPEYTMAIFAKDKGDLVDTLYREIRVLDVNEAPSFEVEPCVIAEGNEIGDSLGHVERPSDPDQFSRNPEFYTNYFKLTGGNTELFDLKRDPNDPMKIVLVAKVEFDCESGKYVCDKNGAYSVELAYGDTTLKTVYSDLKVPVTIRDINEKPTVLTDTVKVKENAPKGTVVDTVKWKDVDKFDSEMQFKIAEDPTDCFDIGSKSGIITVKKDKCSALDYEKTTIIPIKVAVTDSLGKGVTVTKPITVKVLDVNEAPSIVKETFVVDEDAKKGSVVDTVKATDPDKDPKYNKLIYKVIGGDTATFKIDSITGIVTLKDTLDYETKNKYEIVVRVFDGEFADTATVPIYVNNKDEKTEVKITLYDDSTKVWHDPDTVYTNSPGRELCWVQGRSDRDLKDTCMNVHIKKDTVIVIRYKDPTTDSYGVDSLVIFFSNAAPVVTIEGDQDANLANNFYTIIENTDKADTNLYVNERKKDVRVTVKDPASKTDTSFVVNLKLETVNVPQKTLDKVNTIVKENSFILNENPKGGVTRTPVNGNEVKVSYKEVLGKDTVTVSYMTDANGDPVMVPVVNDKGKIDSIEVMTVSYNTVIDGKTVTVSFVVNSVTGEVLVKDSNGTLMESGASKVASSSSSKGNTSSSSSSSSGSTSYVTEGMFQITYSQKDALGNSTTVTYSVNEKGKLVQNSDGDSGYAVSYTYTNKYGNAATQSLYIVLDQKGPTVEILKPVKGQVIRSNYVEVVWTVNGVTQDTLTVQGLDKGPNYIKRFYRDKAGNEAADTVLVIMKDSKDVDIAVVKPVTEMNPEEVKEYYEENPPEEGETFAVSILNPTSGKEVETLKGGTFDTKKGSGEELYPGKDKKHLGPTLALDVKLPTIKDGEGNTGLGGLATLDDLILPNGKISNIGIGIDTSKLSDELKREYKEYTVEEYVEKFCEDGTKVPSDFSKFNMYNTKMQVKIWVYTSLGSFVDYFSFSQDMNDPDYTNDAGKLKMFFEMKPDRDGFVKADNGKMMGTGAYLYKVEATIRSTLRCTILDEAVLHDKPNAKRKGDKIKSSDDLLKPFGYKRPKTK
ncbi:MAG: cadherin domain-containing protein [Fibrobacter sp.]|nr:cadherin domain-containing protein [Fibrobacter sp.]